MDISNEGYIYITTNIINGKKYIGQTNGNSKYYIGGGKLFLKAFKKYGRKSFRKKILEICDIEKLDEREIFWIKNFNADNDPNFYNLSSGGKGGVNENTRKKVCCYSREGEYLNTYSSTTLASLSLFNTKIYSSQISDSCRKDNSLCKNFQWKYDDSNKIITNYDEYISNVHNSYYKHKNIFQYNDQGDIINKWNNTREISNTFGINFKKLKLSIDVHWKTIHGNKYYFSIYNNLKILYTGKVGLKMVEILSNGIVIFSGTSYSCNIFLGIDKRSTVISDRIGKNVNYKSQKYGLVSFRYVE